MSEQRHVYRIAWDGEPSMSGQPHVVSVGREFDSYADARRAIGLLPTLANKPDIRVEARLVSEWERCRD